MRILIVDTFYPAFTAAHYERDPGLAERPYAEQWRALMDTFFGTADSYSHHLGELGHPAHEFVVNCAPLQQRWAQEHGVDVRRLGRRRGGASRDRILLAQADWFRPDVCYVQNLEVLSIETLRALSRRGCLLVGQVSTEPPPLQRLAAFDLLVSPLPFLADRFRRHGLRCEYLPLAFDDRVLGRLDPEDRAGGEETVFVGSLKRFRRWSSNGVVERAARRVRVDFWGYGVRQWPRRSPMRANYHGEAWGLDMLGILHRSRIALNRHGDFSGDEACNMRMYEATGVGAMLLTDAKRNLGDLFAPGQEVVTYRTEEELVAGVRQYLEDEAARAEIARAGQERTLAEHTYARRMTQLVELLEQEVGRREAA